MRIRSVLTTAGAVLLGCTLSLSAASAASQLIDLSPNPIDFGAVEVDSSTLLASTVTNTSGQPIQVTAPGWVDFATPDAFTYDENAAPGTPRDDACWWETSGSSIDIQTVPVGGTCLLYYRFTPTTAGRHDGHATVAIYDQFGSTLDTTQLDMTGTTGGAATTGGITVSPASLNFGGLNVGDASTMTVTVTNTSDGNVQVDPTYTANYGNGFPSASGDCVESGNNNGFLVLAPQDTCVVRVRFSSPTPGSKNGQLTLTEMPATSPAGELAPLDSTTPLTTSVVPLTAAAYVATFDLAPTSLAFGSVPRNTDKVMSTVVHNTSHGPLRFDAAYPAGSPFHSYLPSPGVTGDCLSADGALAVAAGGTCNLKVVYTPNATGAQSAAVVVQAHRATSSGRTPIDTPVGATKTLNVTGTGVAATWTLTPTSLAFGNVTLTAHKTMTTVIKNTSNRTLQFVASFPAGSEFHVFAPRDHGASDCYSSSGADGPEPSWTTVAAGSSCNLRVEYVPTTTGAKTTPVTVTARDVSSVGGSGYLPESGTPVGTRSFNATGTGAAPTYTVSPASLAYGALTEEATKSETVTVKNTSTVSLRFEGSVPDSADYWVDNDPFGFDQDGCVVGSNHRVIAPGLTCTVTLVFSPRKLGADNTTLSVKAFGRRSGSVYDVPAGAKNVTATGSGIAPTYTLAPSPLAFGNLTKDGTKLQDVTVTNTSGVAMRFEPSVPAGSDYYLPGDDFFFPDPDSCVPNNGDHIVSPGDTCTFSVVFRPSKVGADNTTITVKAYRPGAWGDYSTLAVTKTLSATGAGIAPTYTLTPSPLAFGNVTQDGTKLQDVTVTNTSSIMLRFEPSVPAGADYHLPGDDFFFPDPDACNPDTDQHLVAPGDTCTFSVVFRPSKVGADNTTVTVKAFEPGPWGDYTTLAATKTLSGTGAGIAPTYTLAPSPLAYGNVTKEATQLEDVTVTNTSGVALRFEPFLPDGSDYYIPGEGPFPEPTRCDHHSDTDGDTIVAPGDTCTFPVVFNPRKTGTDNTTITVKAYRPGAWGDYTTLAVTKTLSATGNGIAPTYTFTPTSLGFGTVRVGTSKTLRVVIKNTSGVALFFDPAYPAGSRFHTFVASSPTATDCVSANGPEPLAPGESCNLRIEFTPTSKTSTSSTIAVHVQRPSGFGELTTIATRNVTASGTGG